MANTSYGNDIDIDVLRLFVAPRITLLSPNAPRSMEIFTRATTFWSTAHLRHLLDWTDLPAPRASTFFGGVEVRLERGLARLGGTVSLIQHCETLTRRIFEWELALSRLSCLRSPSRQAGR